MILHTIIVVFGLALFETVSSIDNAIVNVHVLSTVPEKYKKFLWKLQNQFYFSVGGVYLFLVFLSWLFPYRFWVRFVDSNANLFESEVNIK